MTKTMPMTMIEVLVFWSSARQQVAILQNQCTWPGSKKTGGEGVRIRSECTKTRKEKEKCGRRWSEYEGNAQKRKRKKENVGGDGQNMKWCPILDSCTSSTFLCTPPFPSLRCQPERKKTSPSNFSETKTNVAHCKKYQKQNKKTFLCTPPFNPLPTFKSLFSTTPPLARTSSI